jgi:hypothetical protein
MHRRRRNHDLTFVCGLRNVNQICSLLISICGSSRISCFDTRGPGARYDRCKAATSAGRRDRASAMGAYLCVQSFAMFLNLTKIFFLGCYRGSASVTRHQVVASSSSRPNSHSISHVMAASLSANVRKRRRGSENRTDRERQKSIQPANGRHRRKGLLRGRKSRSECEAERPRRVVFGPSRRRAPTAR